MFSASTVAATPVVPLPVLDDYDFRVRIDKLPLLDVSRLETRRECQRAYSLLSIAAHSYVWGQGLDIAQSIPEPLAVPLQTISDILDIPPVLTYAGCNKFNMNVTAIHCMTGTSDQDWLVIVSIAVEVEGGATLQPLLETMHGVRRNDPEAILIKLKETLLHLEKVGKLLTRIFERCDPAVFYWKIRKFLSGSENAASLGLPNGLEFNGVNNNEHKYHMGATGGQSSLFLALDVILGIERYENTLLAKMKRRPTELSSTTLPKSPTFDLLFWRSFRQTRRPSSRMWNAFTTVVCTRLNSSETLTSK
ncbi:hypothetical protein MVEG_11467 [Podila verticillata NRRL 6337]|uniref:Indoleamine 2,3-dioxygenase n=1 Tax=Podila verticillata NRRL 6337 TaxID=1069443 RepID=A0A086TJX9_9FUNG|nr:hypothetical protein MVEG_11467 [Podila verticillata NRRL 6337]